MLGAYINPDEIAARLIGDYDDRVRLAQMEADHLRDLYLKEDQSFAFETVMSHPSKIETLQKAKLRGFDVVLYFVSTNDPNVNVARVAQRVIEVGHDVPVERIIAMALLPAAIEVADRAFLFDKSQLWRDGKRHALSLAAIVEKKQFGESNHRSIRYIEPVPDWVFQATRMLKSGGAS